MMNLLAICLVLTSLLAAEVWSPTHTTLQNQKEEDVIVKEGHRTIVVETFDRDGHHNTKVSISPEIRHDTVLSSIYEKAKDAARVLPNIGQGISHEGRSYDIGDRHTPGELTCDALGKCTHRIASAIGKAKDKISEVAHDVVGKDKELAHEAKEMAEKAIYKKKKIAHEAKDRVEDAYEKAKDTASATAHHAKEAVGVAYEDSKGGAKESYHKAKKAVKDTVDLGDTIRKDVGRNVSEEVANVKKKVKETAKEAKEEVANVKKKVEETAKEEVANVNEKVEESAKEAKENTKRAKNRVSRFFKHALGHVATPVFLNNVTGVVNLLGFSTAYGTCVWVTFISSHVLAGALPRQQFGMVQSKIYPVYFRTLLSGIGMSLLGYMVGQRSLLFGSRAKRFQAYNLLASMLMVLVNALYLEPVATKVMFERMRIEKEEGIKQQTEYIHESELQPAVAIGSTAASTTPEIPATVAETPELQEERKRIAGMNLRLKKLNSYSSFLNILTLMSLTWHLVYQCHSLHMRC